MSLVIPVVSLSNLMLTNTCWTPPLTGLVHRSLPTFHRTNGPIQPRPVSHRLPGACLKLRAHLRLAQLRARLTSSLFIVLPMRLLRTFGRPLIPSGLALRLLPVATALAPMPPACRTSIARCLMSSELLAAVPDPQRSNRTWWKPWRGVLVHQTGNCLVVFSGPCFLVFSPWFFLRGCMETSTRVYSENPCLHCFLLLFLSRFLFYF
jgi:hypothetical protein